MDCCTQSVDQEDMPAVWVANGVLHAGGGHEGQGFSPLSSIEKFDQSSQQWVSAGTFPEIKDAADATVLANKVYVVSGKNSNGYSNKVYAADLLPHRDLYFRSVASETVNREPTSIFALGDLNISENQPVGTIVGEFNATDPDTNSTLTYHLVNGVGDGNNSLFTLDSNGTLRVFDIGL